MLKSKFQNIITFNKSFKFYEIPALVIIFHILFILPLVLLDRDYTQIFIIPILLYIVTILSDKFFKHLDGRGIISNDLKDFILKLKDIYRNKKLKIKLYVVKSLFYLIPYIFISVILFFLISKIYSDTSQLELPNAIYFIILVILKGYFLYKFIINSFSNKKEKNYLIIFFVPISISGLSVLLLKLIVEKNPIVYNSSLNSNFLINNGFIFNLIIPIFIVSVFIIYKIQKIKIESNDGNENILFLILKFFISFLVATLFYLSILSVNIGNKNLIFSVEQNSYLFREYVIYMYLSIMIFFEITEVIPRTFNLIRNYPKFDISKKIGIIIGFAEYINEKSFYQIPFIGIEKYIILKVHKTKVYLKYPHTNSIFYPSKYKLNIGDKIEFYGYKNMYEEIGKKSIKYYDSIYHRKISQTKRKYFPYN